jgi:hypothetical protein
MKLILHILNQEKRLIVFVIGLLFMFISCKNANAQIFNEVQSLDFGYFMTSNNGGSIVINHDTGIATTTGKVILVSGQSMGIYDCTITGAKKINLYYSSSVQLNGSGSTSGHHLSLSINDNGSNHNYTWNKGYVKVSLGGTLTVRNLTNNPVGGYSNLFFLNYTVTY